MSDRGVKVIFLFTLRKTRTILSKLLFNRCLKVCCIISIKSHNVKVFIEEQSKGGFDLAVGYMHLNGIIVETFVTFVKFPRIMI